MNKRFIIIIILVFITIVGGVIFFQMRQNGRVLPPGALQAIPTPSFPDQATSFSPTYTLTTSPPAVPAAISIYTYKRPIDVQVFAKPIAATLGFTGEPTIFTGDRGTFYSWSRGEATLSIGGDPMEIAYFTGAQAVDTVTLPESQAHQKALALIQSLKTNTPQLTRLASRYFAPTSPSSPVVVATIDRATMVELHYRYSLDGLPVFTRFPSVSSLTVRVNSRNEIISLTGYLFAGVQKQNTTLAPLQEQEAIKKLESGIGTLVSYENAPEEGSEEPVETTIQTTNIHTVEFGYYYTPNQQQLAPVYVFSGTGINRVTGKPVKTTTILSALP